MLSVPLFEIFVLRYREKYRGYEHLNFTSSTLSFFFTQFTFHPCLKVSWPSAIPKKAFFHKKTQCFCWLILLKLYVDMLVFTRTLILDKNLALQHFLEFSEQLFLLFFKIYELCAPSLALNWGSYALVYCLLWCWGWYEEELKFWCLLFKEWGS